MPGFETNDAGDPSALQLPTPSNRDASVAADSGIDTDINLDDGDDTSIIIDDGSDGDVDTDGGGDDIDAQSLDSKTVPIAAPIPAKSTTKSPVALLDRKEMKKEDTSTAPVAVEVSSEEEAEEEDGLGAATNLPQVGAVAVSMARKSSYRPNLHESMMKLSTSMVERVSGSVIVASQSRLASGSHVGRSLHLTGSLRDALVEQTSQIKLGDSANKKLATSMSASAVATAAGTSVGPAASSIPGSTTATTTAGAGATTTTTTPSTLPPVTVAVSLVRTSSGFGGTVALAPVAATTAASMVLDPSAVSAVQSGAEVQILRGSSGATYDSSAWDEHSAEFDEDANEQLINERGLRVLQRVLDKLTGLDFAPVGDGPTVALDVPEQIDRLIKQATSNENLCVCFFGWCPFW
jgi:hypothetical protein